MASGEEVGNKAEIRQHLLLPQGTVHWVGEMERTAKTTGTNASSLVTVLSGGWGGGGEEWERGRSACQVMTVE